MRLHEIAITDIKPLRLTKIQQKILLIVQTEIDAEMAYAACTIGSAKMLKAMDILDQLRLVKIEAKSVTVTAAGTNIALRERLIDETGSLTKKGQEAIEYEDDKEETST